MTNPEIEKKSPNDNAFYRFGDFCLDSKRNVLTASGEPVALTYKAIQTLLVLVVNQGRIVTKDEILERVWKDTFVEENSLTRNISVLRKVLGETPNSKKFIETVPRRGYRFIHKVTKIADSAVCESEVTNIISTDEIETVENKFPRYSENETPKTVSQKTFFDAEFKENPVSNLGEKSLIAESQIKTHLTKRMWVATLLFVLLIIGSTSVIFSESIRKYFKGSATVAETVHVSVSKFTNTGNTLDATISQDGKYVAYVADEGTRQSLWVRQTSDDGSSRAIQILPPSEVAFQGLAFAPDGNSVYYNVWDRQGVGEIYRIPVLGGIPVEIIHDCLASVSVSPANGKIAFIRVNAKENEEGLLISDADGKEEKLIARLGDNEWVSAAAWSPDGKSLSVALGKADMPEKPYIQLQEIFVETGERKLSGSKKWFGINQIAWQPNGQGLILSGVDDETQKSSQLWQVTLPSGNVQKLTSEASGYNGISSITADGSAFVAVQRTANYNIWTAPFEHPGETTKITDGRNEGRGACWTRGGRIVFTSLLETNPNVWIMEADGSGKKQLTGGNFISYNPVASLAADGSIYFVSNRSSGPQIWRMDENGQNLTQMTENYAGGRYSVSPDGKSLIYVREVPGEPNTLWKIPTNGAAGEPKRLSELNSYAPSLSPDGKLIAYSFWDEPHTPPQWAYEIISSEDGRKIKSLNFPLTVNVAAGAVYLGWLPDQSGIAYIDFQNKVSNVWVQPLDEKRRAFQLTNFKDGRVFQFNWSPDGKRILFVRGNELSDVVLVKIS